MQRGELRVYIGAAPGVGKSHAMLDEGLRRMARGTDVVIAALDDTDRSALTRLAQPLERIVPSMSTAPADVALTEIRRRRPAVVLVDDLARRVGDGPMRWELADRLLDEGFDVVGTLDISSLESLRDIVAGITGASPSASVPDAFITGAAQLELVDMSPQALRRRLAHGHVYPSEQVDAATANLFRPEVLGALRQLTLLWMADRVEEQLERDLLPGLVDDSGDVRERVVVALAGEGGDHLVRRAARLAGRTGAQLVGVHVVSSGRAAGPDLERQRRLLTGLGGVYREVVGDDIVEALATFARVEQATQIVLGTRPDAHPTHSASSVVGRMLARVGAADLHVVAAAGPTTPPRVLPVRARRRARPRRLVALAWALSVVALPVVTAVMVALRPHVSVGSALLVDLCVVMAAAAAGGVWPGIVASLAAVGLTNWFLTPPLHTLAVSGSQNIVALSVFVMVTIVVSVLVDRAARRSSQALSSRAEATALARSAATLVGAHDPLPDLLEQLRATFGLDAASVLERTDGGWWPAHVSGSPQLFDPADGTSIDLSADGNLRLVVAGGALRPEQLEVLRAFADQLAMGVETRRLRADAANADLIAEADALRASLLQAVSHDFRTPLATIKASASGLLHVGAEFSEADRRLLLADIEGAADRLDRMVRDLLDMSRLQAGAVTLQLGNVALEEVVASALAGLPDAARRVVVDVSEALPMVVADAALLERALANIVSNAMAWSPPDTPVRVTAGLVGRTVDLRVVDRGPGIARADRERVFVPFQRFGDRSTDAGAGLGLAIAKGFVEAMGAQLGLDDTPGGGLTLSIRLAVADEEGA